MIFAHIKEPEVISDKNNRHLCPKHKWRLEGDL